MSDKDHAGQITLVGARLSYPRLWQPKSMDRDDGTPGVPKYEATFLLPKDPGAAKEIGCYAVVGGKKYTIGEGFKLARFQAIEKKTDAQTAREMKIRPEAFCLKDGDYDNAPETDGMFIVGARNANAPKVVGRDKRPLTASDGIPYAGCYVNGVIRLWYQKGGRCGRQAPSTRGLGVTGGGPVRPRR